MSDMLEQAIIDAQALKEAATKNAETLVLEKYSSEIKKAVDTLLEQDDFAADLEASLTAPAPGGPGGEAAAAPAAAGPDMAATPAASAPPGTAPLSPEDQSSVMQHIPLAVTSDSSDQIEIPLDQLFEEITKLSETMRFSGDEVFDESLYQEEDYGLEEDDYGLEEDYGMEEYDLEEVYLEEDYLEEDYGIEEAGTRSAGHAWPHGHPAATGPLGEHLTVDVKPVKNGWATLPEGELRLAEEELLALEQDSKYREEQEAKRKAVRELNAVNETVTKQNKKLIKTLNKSSKYMTKLRDIVLTLEEKLDKTNLFNAKLLYQNKALDNDSLNERQKQKLVEAISNAETIEEAKVIYGTLQNTVGSTSRKKQPNSLSEAIQKSSSVILSARKENSGGQKQNPTLDRWKFLAGIDK